MAPRGLADFIRREGRGLAGIGLAVLATAIILVAVSRGGTLPPLSYGAAANLIIAIVAVTSLYIAWREFVRKTEPNVTIEFGTTYPDVEGIRNRMVLKATNSGANIITPINAWYGLVRKEASAYYLTNEDMCAFDEDALRPGDTAEATLDDDVVVMQLKNVNFRDWTGEGVSIDRFGRDRRQVRLDLVEPGGDAQVKIQKLFDVVMDIPHHTGLRISEEEIQSSSVEELVEEYGLDRERIVSEETRMVLP